MKKKKQKITPPKKGTKPMRQTGLYLGVAQLESARELAERDGTTLSEVVRRALDFYLTLKASHFDKNRRAKHNESQGR